MGSDMVGTVCRIGVVPAQEVPGRAHRDHATVAIRRFEPTDDAAAPGHLRP